MTCSTCDGYQLIDADNDGVYDSACPDCRSNVERCPVHGRTLIAGRCRECSRQATNACAILRARAQETAQRVKVIADADRVFVEGSA